MKTHARLLQYLFCTMCLLSSFSLHPMQPLQWKSWVPRSIQDLTFTQKAIGTALITMALMYAVLRARSVWYGPIPPVTARDTKAPTTMQTPALATSSATSRASKKLLLEQIQHITTPGQAVLQPEHPRLPSQSLPQALHQTTAFPNKPPINQTIRRQDQPTLSEQSISQQPQQISPPSLVITDEYVKQRAAEVVFDALFDIMLQGNTNPGMARLGDPLHVQHKDYENIEKLFAIFTLKRQDILQNILQYAQNFTHINTGAYTALYTEKITIPEAIHKKFAIDESQKDKAYLTYWLNLDMSALYEDPVIQAIQEKDTALNIFEKTQNYLKKPDDDWGNWFRISEGFHLYREARGLMHKENKNKEKQKDLLNFCTQLLASLLDIPQAHQVSMNILTKQTLLEQRARLQKIKQQAL